LEPDWIHDLSSSGAARDRAVSDLRARLLSGLELALGRRTDLNRSDLEDFAQEALLRVLANLDQFNGRSRFLTWARTVAVNLAYERLRRKHWRNVSLESLAKSGETLSDEILRSLPRQVDSENARDRIVELLRTAINTELNPRQRTAISGLLREVPVDQLAERLGITRGAFYKLTHDARLKLRHALESRGIVAADIPALFATT
jgi:RNA polymerase sigma-70 factor (ECF subfamily)